VGFVTIDALALALLQACCSPSDRDAVVGDAYEEYEDLIRSRGALFARAWLWRQVMISVPVLLWLRVRRLERGAPIALTGLAVAIGCAVVIGVQSCASATGSGLTDLGLHGTLPWVRVIGSVLAFACGGWVTAWVAGPAPIKALAAFAALCVGLSLFFLWPVAATVYAAGATVVVYHLLLLALIVPSIIAGSTCVPRSLCEVS
jgi:hypothetical protein